MNVSVEPTTRIDGDRMQVVVMLVQNNIINIKEARILLGLPASATTDEPAA